ncbi:hypothetical protein SpCBS45565_g01258 [Spizellomyces sp. 'palustris']|nr:hypothetical protein SpCBS45565_g01258 [Spizellomyces sp. 'palustris']
MSGKYIVVFKSDTPQEVVDKAAKDVEASGEQTDGSINIRLLPELNILMSLGGTVGHRYDSVMKGFSATLPDNVLTTFESHDKVDYIEADGEVSTYAKSKGIGK